MDVNEFEKQMTEAPERVDEEAIRENLSELEKTEEKPAEDPDGQAEEQPVSMPLAQLAGMVTGVYCRLSDYIFTKVKKTSSAPEWSEHDREAIENAVAPVLGKYNVTLSPATNLIITLTIIEGIRYTTYKPVELPEKQGSETK